MARIDVIGPISADEELVIQAITDGTYFVENGVPTGIINGSNKDFTLASIPNPATSLKVYLNGQRLKITEDYTLSGNTLSLVVAPETGDLLLVDYRFSPA
jgi:hypothetical protein